VPEKIVKKTNFVGLFLLYLIKVQDFIDHFSYISLM
jgi:hypothetical protein